MRKNEKEKKTRTMDYGVIFEWDMDPHVTEKRSMQKTK